MPELRLPLLVAELVGRFGGTAMGEGAAERKISGFASLGSAGEGDLAFFKDASRADELRSTGAGAVVLKERHANWHDGASIAVDKDPRDYFAMVVDACVDDSLAPGVDPGAHVDPGAEVAADAHVGPGVVIGAGARIGARTKVMPGTVVAEGCTVGEDCCLHHSCVIGSEGFGFYNAGDGHRRFKHQGSVVLCDRVEIGANSCVERGVLDDTHIGAGTKIGSLVQVGHNVRMGRDCLLSGCVAVAGSVTIGDGCVIGGGAGIREGTKIADHVVIMAKTAVVSDITEPGGKYGGPLPHMPHGKLLGLWRRMLKQDGNLPGGPDA